MILTTGAKKITLLYIATSARQENSCLTSTVGIYLEKCALIYKAS